MADYGEKYEYDLLWKGILLKRSCTDIRCLFIFVVFIISWSSVGFYAFLKGDVRNLTVPIDSNGRKCGQDPDVRNAPFLVFTDLRKCLSITNCKTKSVCQERCPSEKFFYPYPKSGIPRPVETLKIVKTKMICTSEKALAAVKFWPDLDKLVKAGTCAEFYSESAIVAHRCLPKIPKTWENSTVNLEDLRKAGKVMKTLAKAEHIPTEIWEDAKKAWVPVVAVIAASAVLCVVYMLLLKCFVTPIVYATVLAVCLLLSWAAYQSYSLYKNSGNQSYLAGLICCAVILGVVVLCTIFLRNRIFLACQLVKESSEAVTSISSTLVFPIFPWILQLLVVASVVAVGIFLASIATPNYRVQVYEKDKCICKDSLNYQNNSKCDPVIFEDNCKEDNGYCTSAACVYQGKEFPAFIIALHAVNVFGFYWFYFFISALGHMILAGTFATWYWTFNKSDVTFFDLTASTYRTFRYHLGTIAFASVLIPICSIIRTVFDYTLGLIKSNTTNSAVSCLLGACKCCCDIVDWFLKLLNNNPLIMCAIHGKSFISSAMDAINLLMRNILRVFVLNKVTGFVLFIGKITVTLSAAAFMWFCCEKLVGHPLHYKIVPVVLVAIGSYSISSLFFSVLSSAVDTLFLCFLEDSERNDGSPEKPYFMSQRLREVLWN